MDPERALRSGPGMAALVGPAEKTTLPLVARAARRIRRETKGAVQSDLLFVLQALSRRRYAARELAERRRRPALEANHRVRILQGGRRVGAAVWNPDPRADLT